MALGVGVDEASSISFRLRARRLVGSVTRRRGGPLAHQPSGRGPGCGGASEREIGSPNPVGGGFASGMRSELPNSTPAKINRGFLTTTRSQHWLGLVAGSRGPTQIHIRGLCHWAGEPAGHLGAESPSRRTSGPASARKPSPPCSHRLNGLFQGRGARMRCPGASVLCLLPPLVALSLTRLAIRSGQSHPGLYTQPHQPGSG